MGSHVPWHSLVAGHRDSGTDCAIVDSMMSDQTLCVGYWNANYEEWEDVRPASPADLLAALVKAVEEGTIEGAEMMTSNVSGGFVQLAGSVAMDERGPGVDYLVVPVREGPNQ